MKNYTPVLEPDKYYHVFNHAVSNDNLFKNKNNYLFFLKKYAQYITPIADTFAYCLMPNHFHFAIRIKDEKEIETAMRTLPKFANKDLTGFENLSGLYTQFVSQQFSNLFNSYTKSFNKQQNRQGSLFRRPFKRLLIDSNDYFREIIHYIHFNPVHHGFVEDLREWEYSSFESFFSEKATLLKREEVVDWFDNKDNFYAFHHKEIDKKMSFELEL